MNLPYLEEQKTKENNLVLNGRKFQVIRYDNNENPKYDPNCFTDDTSDIIERFESLRDLGVILSDGARFVENVVRKV